MIQGSDFPTVEISGIKNLAYINGRFMKMRKWMPKCPTWNQGKGENH
jgi:hypothetical protein